MKYTGIKENEIFVGNTNVTKGVKLPDYLQGLKTARLGEQALDIKGELIEQDYCRPLFIGKSEADLYDRIMMERLKQAARS